MMHSKCLFAALLSLAALSEARAQSDPEKSLRIEGGLSSLAYNTIQRPFNSSADRFSLRPLLGTGNQGFGRITYEYFVNESHGLRFVIAPLRDTGTGVLPNAVRYEGKTFAAGLPTKAVYAFNGYRATYWNQVCRSQKTDARIGITLNIRQAEVTLAQGNTYAHYTNVGPVPLAYFEVNHSLSPRLKLSAEADAFAVPKGRAIDANVRLAYELSGKTDFLIGLRTLEGGVEEKNKIYNYTRYNYLTAGLGFKL